MASFQSRRRQRCAICHHGFTADPRVGDRQRVCSRPECQKARLQGTQAGWRKRHPGYFIAWRAKKRAKASESDVIDPPRVPAPLDELPWDLAQEEFGSIGADFMASFGRKVLGQAKDQSRAEELEDKGGSGKEDRGVAKDPLSAQEDEIAGGSPEVVGTVPKDQSRAVAVCGP